MTPPEKKPVSPPVEDAEAQEAEIATGAEGSAAPAKATVGRRRAASMELRVAARRSAAASEEGDDPALTPKSGRASTGRTSAGRASSARSSSARASAGRASSARAGAASIRSVDAEGSDTGSAEAETASASSGRTASGRATRSQSTGLRQGPRAQQRAAKAALLESSAQSEQEGPADLEGAEVLIAAPVASPAADPPLAPYLPDMADQTDTLPPQQTSAIDEPAPDEPARHEPEPIEVMPVPAMAAQSGAAVPPPAPPPRRRALSAFAPEIATPPAPAPTFPAQTLPAPTLPAPAQPLPTDPALDDEDGTDDDRVPGRRRMGPRAEKRAARANKSNDAAHYVVAPTVNLAEMRPRHYGVIAAFILMVVLPTISYSWYLWTKAADQYESNAGFGSRTEEASSTFDFLGALGGVSQSGANDMDILYQFIVSQELVAKVDRELDLKAIYSKPKDDPLNTFNPKGTIEDLVAFWQHMVKVNYDNGTGLMSLQVYAFDPQDAQRIAQMILTESTQIINDLSMTAQEDTTRYSKEAMRATEEKLSQARLAVLDYQIKNGIVDPTNTIATQNSIIGNLNQQLTTAQVELDLLAGTVGKNDLRISTLNRKIEVIQNRIAVEQAKVGAAGSADSPGFAELMQEFQRLKVDQDFAERAYLSALAAYDQSVADAQHKTRYLTSFVAPTLAESSTAPNRPLAALIVAVVGFLLWAISILMYYALRDRR